MTPVIMTVHIGNDMGGICDEFDQLIWGVPIAPFQTLDCGRRFFFSFWSISSAWRVYTNEIKFLVENRC